MKRALRLLVLVLGTLIGSPFVLLFLAMGAMEALFDDDGACWRHTVGGQVLRAWLPWHKVLGRKVVH